jgi:hypothetical protein
MKKISVILFVCVFLAVAVNSAYAAEAFQLSTELRQYDSSKAYNGYTVFTPFKFGPGTSWTTWVIDMEGNVVHSFNRPYGPGLHAYLLEEGNWLRGAQVPAATAADTYGVLTGPRCGRLEELDWNGNLLWGYDHFDENSISHHDFHKIWNNQLGEYTYIMNTFERKSATDAINLGGDPIYQSDWEEGTDGLSWSLDGIIEVNQAGEVIWFWSFGDHLVTTDPADTALAVEFLDATGRADMLNSPALEVADMAGIAANPQKLDINWETPYGGPTTDWTHCNSLDYNQALDQIVVNAKHMSEFYVIDHGGTFVSTTDWTANYAAARSAAGDFIYRFGNPSAYNQGLAPGYHDEGEQQMYASHDIQWINDYHWEADASGQGRWPDPGSDVALPGGGNFLIFDNGTWCPIFTHSEILEIDGFETGPAGVPDPVTGYVNPPDAGYTSMPGQGGVGAVGFELSNQVPWRFQSVLNSSFNSTFISGAQRLPNGNTVIMSGATGHMFEVTVAGEVVWEYINPEATTGIKEVQDDTDAFLLFSTFRCHRYSPDYPGLAGKTLVPVGTLTGRVPMSGIGETADYQEALTGFGFSGLGIGGGGGTGAGGGGGSGGY